MKTLIYTISIFTLVMLLLSCESILDKEPLGRADVTNYYDIKDTYMEALTGVYDQLHYGYARQHRPGIVGDAMSDDIRLAQTPNAQIIAHANYTFSSQNQNTGTWEGLYYIISLANIFLDNVSDDQDDLSERARGEAYFLRGFAYHELARWFGRAQIFTSNPTSSAGFYTARASSEETWGQAISDLINATERLPAEYPDKDLGRATKGAAFSYLAKTYLYKERYDSVLYYIDQVQKLGVYDLHQDYGDNFTIDGENGIESILEVQFGFSNGPFGFNGEQHNYLQTYGPKGLSGKIGFSNNLQGVYEPSVELFNSYASHDKRIEVNFILPGDVVTYDGQTIVAPTDETVFKSVWSSTGIANRKWVVGPSAYVLTHNAWTSTLNWSLMRYAELLLMQAEAMHEQNQFDQALAPLNRVRIRAGLNVIQPGEVSPQALQDSIRIEYRRELAFEAHRFWHVARWGNIPQNMIDRGFVIGKHELYPVPLNEIDRNPELDQNPNW